MGRPSRPSSTRHASTLAHRYLIRHDRTLSDIAAELGFSELSAFSRWFRRHAGQSPSRIRTGQQPRSDPT
ncbi:helix-turn-helix domain-containing protein [Nocardia nova]|uniref:helix-turn-helix domain-containing protein n=1 Tax=Nocardia nova TaxID=37330 RepID=UPI0037A14A02